MMSPGTKSASSPTSGGDGFASFGVAAGPAAAALRLAAVQLFQMRAGKLVGRLGYTADASGLEPGLILQRVIEEHYSQVDSVEVPPELLVQHALPQQKLMEDWLTEQRERRVQIHCPQRQQKADLIELVQRNAEFELLRAKQGQEKQSLATELSLIHI